MATEEHFVDDQFAATLAPFSHTFEDVYFDQPIEVTRGRCWYNLHVVLAYVELTFRRLKKANFDLFDWGLRRRFIGIRRSGHQVAQEFSFEWQTVRL